MFLIADRKKKLRMKSVASRWSLYNSDQGLFRLTGIFSLLTRQAGIGLSRKVL